MEREGSQVKAIEQPAKRPVRSWPRVVVGFGIAVWATAMLNTVPAASQPGEASDTPAPGAPETSEATTTPAPDAPETSEAATTPAPEPLVPEDALPPGTPRFRLPSELDGPPGLELPATSVPETETAGSAAESPAPDAVDEPPPPRVQRLGYAAPLGSVMMRRYGQFRLIGPTELMIRRYNGPELTGGGTPYEPRALIHLTATHAYVDGPLRDWSGAQVVADVRINEHTRTSVFYEHELRERTGDLVGFSMLGYLSESAALEVSAAGANKTEFLPVTELQTWVRAQAPAANLLYGVGVDAAWLTGRRQLVLGLAQAQFWTGPVTRLGFEGRLGAAAAEGANSELAAIGRFELAQGDHGSALFVWDVAAGWLPDHVPPFEFEAVGRRPTLESSVGLRYWLGEDYGFLSSLGAGGQIENYWRISADLGLFLEVP